MWWKPFEALYSSVQLLLLHVPFDELPQHYGWRGNLFHFARVLAVVFIGATAGALVYRFFGNQLLRIGRAWIGGHTVICGFNRIGKQLALEFSKDRPIVIHNSKASAAAIYTAAESGAALLEGNPADLQVLSQARILAADRLFAALDNDGANVGIALRAVQLAKERRVRPPSDLQILVHITNPQLRATLHRQRTFSFDPKLPRVSMFNVFENSARRLLLGEHHELDYSPIGERDERAVRLIVIGFGLMGEAVLTRAAMVAHYANFKMLQAVVIDLQAARKEQLFRSRYQQFARVADAQFLQLDAEEPSTQDRIAQLCADTTRAISTVVISFDNDSRGLSLALSLLPRLHKDIPIRLRLNDQSGLADLKLPRQITVYGSMHDACAREQDLDKMAKALHNGYRQWMEQENQAKHDDPNMLDWEQLDDDLLDSNRQAADHIPVKLRAISCHAAKDNDDDTGILVHEIKPGEELELLARMEHQRWMAERFMAGWALGKKDYDNRISPNLIPWDQLPENVQTYDRTLVSILPSVLEQVGQKIRRI